MADKTGISWTDATWNCVTGCSKVSEGCRNCYAAALAPRLAAMGQKGYTDLPWTKANAPENVFLHPDRLEMPIRMTRPRRIFVNSMSDLFHEQVPDEFIDRVFAVMALAPRHTFQILTKRPERMRDYATNGFGRLADAIIRMRRERGDNSAVVPLPHIQPGAPWWPLPNVWLGTSVEDQRAADERIPHLLRTPASVRFLSCEPLLGEVNLRGWLGLLCNMCGSRVSMKMACVNCGERPSEAFRNVSWVIAGGESGHGHRPMDHDWMRSLRDQCKAAGVAFFGKQDAGLRNETELPEDLRIREFPEVA